MIFSTETKVLHYAPSRNMFFSGQGGYQVLVRFYRIFGFGIGRKELDREDVPHWHYVQERTLGSSEWRARLVKELDGYGREGEE